MLRIRVMDQDAVRFVLRSFREGWQAFKWDGPSLRALFDRRKAGG